MSIDDLFNHPQKIWVDAGIMFLAVAFTVIAIFLAYRRLDEMEDRLNKCTLVTSHKRIWGKWALGRLVRLCAVMAAVAMPRWNIKRGVVDRQQVQEFPRGLKHLLQGMMLSGILFLSVATAGTLYRWLGH